MGIIKNDVEFLMYCKNQFHVDFTDTAMIGRQSLYLSKEEAKELLLDFGVATGQVEAISADWLSCFDKNCYYSEPLLKWFGSKNIFSFDFSDYEGATCIWDLNQPISQEYWGRYSLVLESGTLEHIFHFPTALWNVMKMTAVGGCLVLSVPGNNWFGHGFYQFSPELFSSIFRKENGFELLEMAVNGADGKLRRIASPLETHRRVEVEHTGKTRASIRVVAMRISEEIPERLDVQQSDYLLVWNGEEQVEETQPPMEIDRNTIETSSDFTFLLEKDRQSGPVVPLVSQRETDMQTLNAALQQRETDIQTLSAALQQRETDIQTLNAALQQRETDIQTLNAALEQQVQEFQVALLQQEKDMKTLEVALKQREIDIQTLETALRQRETDVQTLETALRQRETDVQTLETALRQREIDINTLENALQRQNGR